MKRTTIYALGAAALVAAGAVALTATSFAGSGWYGHRHHGWGDGMPGGMGGHGGPGGHAFRMLEMFDANKDGKLTQAEIDEARQGRFKSFDKNIDGALTLDEFEALWLDFMRERMVDHFQDQDDDGDGKVTPEEFGQRFAYMVQFMDRNGDGVLDAADMRRGHPMRGGGPEEEREGSEQ